ncbi:serine hydrolase domain-containing protein [Sphingomonas sp.]|uniref:serine hydrolase domain-containing protein n=1 Tax=Sphingomonas sp. TaxID=28214 RepID=UPI003B00A66A
MTIGRRAVVGGIGALAMLPARATRPTSATGSIVSSFAREHRFNGIVACATRGRRDFVEAFGWADVESRRPIGLTTRFAFGSASKWLTTVAVLRLVEQGRLDLARAIGTWLPAMRETQGGAVPLRHLLSNTSGIPDRLAAALRADPSLRASTEGSAPIVARLGPGDVAFAPGTGWEYSALNWVIVHALLERVTGLPFAGILDRLVFAPLGMWRAGLVDTRGGRDAATASAYATLDPLKPKMAPLPPFVAASGVVFATVDDALRAAHGIFSGALLSARSRAALTTIAWAQEDYALGGRVRTIGGRRWAWEAGKVEGYRALIAHDLIGDRTIVIFNNTDVAQATISSLAESLATV